MGKIFPHSRRKPKPAQQPFLVKPVDPERHQARVTLERRETERIQAGRHQRMIARSAARAGHAAPAVPKDESDLDADWFAVGRECQFCGGKQHPLRLGLEFNRELH